MGGWKIAEFGTCGLESPELRRLRTCRGQRGHAEVKMFEKTREEW